MHHVQQIMRHLQPNICASNAYLSDYSGTYHCKSPTTNNYWKPCTTKEISSIISQYSKMGHKIRIKGNGLSYNGLGLSNNAIIDLCNYNKIINLNTKNNIVRVESGCTLHKLLTYLNKYNLTLQNYPVILFATIGGIMQTGSHGTDINIGPFETTIKQFKLITSNGIQLILNKDNKLFNYARVGLGCFGVITEIDIQCVPRYALCQHIDFINYKKQKHKIKDMIMDTNYIHPKLFWFPYVNTYECVIVRYKKIEIAQYKNQVEVGLINHNKVEEKCQENMRKIYCELINIKLNDFNEKYKDNNLPVMALGELILGFNDAKYMLNVNFIKKFNVANFEYWKKMKKYFDKQIYNLSEHFSLYKMTKHIHYECVFDIEYITNIPIDIMNNIEKYNIPCPGYLEQRFCRSSDAKLSPVFSEKKNGLFCFLGTKYYIPVSIQKNDTIIRYIYNEFIYVYCDMLNKTIIKYKNPCVVHWAKLHVNDENKQLIRTLIYKKYGSNLKRFLHLQAKMDSKNIFMNDVIENILK
eukprot:538289_1